MMNYLVASSRMFWRNEKRSVSTVIVLGIDGEAELVDEEGADVGASLACSEVERSALVGIPDGSGHGGGALVLLVKRRNKLCR
jgi:hypothetical protein